MKLRNKLLPLTSIVAATGLVAPMVTSCGKNTSIVDITTPYAPTIAKAEALGDEDNPVSLEKAYNLYMNHVMANPDILRQDIWYYESKKLPSRIQGIEYSTFTINDNWEIVQTESTEKTNSITNVIANVFVNNVEVKKQHVIIDGSEVEFYSISMDLGYEYQFTATSLSTEPRVQVTNKFNFTSKYNDIPLYMYSDYERNWHVSIDLLDDHINKYLAELPGWYLDYSIDYESDVALTTEGNTETHVEKESESNTITRTSQIYDLGDVIKSNRYSSNSFLLSYLSSQYLDYVPYHLQDVIGSQSSVILKKNITQDLYLDTNYKWEAYLPDDTYLDVFELSDEAKAVTKKSTYITANFRKYDSPNEDVSELELRDINDEYKTVTLSTDSGFLPHEGENIYFDDVFGYSGNGNFTEDYKLNTVISADGVWMEIAWYDEYGALLKEDTCPLTLSNRDTNLTFNITEKPGSFQTCEWSDLIRDIDLVEAGSMSFADFAKAYTLKGDVVATQTDFSEYIGQEKSLMIDGVEHKVRIIGVNHDYYTESSTHKHALFTFELVTLLSDTNGNAMTSKYDPEATASGTCRNYMNSSLRKNLTGAGEGEQTFEKTALEMLPSELQSGIKTADKEVATWLTDEDTWSVKPYTDKLFPLTCSEMAQTPDGAQVEGTYYTYWNDNNNNSARIKKDANNKANPYLLSSAYTATGWSTASFRVAIEGYVEPSSTLSGGDNTVSFAFCI